MMLRNRQIIMIKMRIFKFVLFFTTAIFISVDALGQGESPDYKEGMTLKFDSAGKKYIRFITSATFWARYTEANPGTAVNGVPKSSWTDLSLRQFRFITVGQLSPRFLILTDIGMDNQAFSSGGVPGGGNTGNGSATFNGTLGKKPGIYLHGLTNEFTLIPDKDMKTGRTNRFSLYIGSGLHYWMGLSRMTSASSSNYLALDAPIYNWPTVELSDQFARELGIYFKECRSGGLSLVT